MFGVWAIHPLAAQTVVRPAPPLDSARAALRDAVLILRDSLVTIDGAAARLQRDYRAASGPALLSRARVMREACARSIRTLPSTREALLSARLTEARRITRRQDLIQALDQLKGALNRCETEFAAMSAPDQAETVRGYANAKAAVVQAALRRYEKTQRDFLGVMGIRVPPVGVSPPPLAG
jgi:hypothetical protein